MLTKVKLYSGLLVGALISFLLGLTSFYKRKSEDNAEEAKKAKANQDLAEERVKRHEDRQKIENDIAMGDEPSIDKRLHDYYRD